ncbi:MAG: glycoside hydrolase family 29 [Chitinophagaceae bacterium]|nr:MAG: glycoside hydrolase family 29 [Chitinophagaceae bacterium]
MLAFTRKPLNVITPAVQPPAPVLPVPSEKQLRYHEMEMNAFIHFTTNTFTDLEWGMGDESPAIFNPASLDATQWAGIVKEAGFKGLILTTKHHDGFCLWPSKFTEHSIKKSPYKNGKGDIVKEVSDATRKAGLKFGVYLSPWDRNRADYGTPSYIEYYRNQLKELFTQYGPVFEMWFDGANGGKGYYGGTNETRKINSATYYDWPKTLETVRAIQPDVLFFSDAGPDIRWVGNERGTAGTTNWNTITTDTLHAGKPNIEKLLNTGSEDGKSWVPAEVDVSIRPGWFYHAKEDSLVKSPEKLFDIYLTSVGRGSNLLLNLPPDRRGLIHENDIRALQGFKKIKDAAFKHDLAKRGKITASNTRGGDKAFAASNLNDSKTDNYWATDDNVHAATAEINLGQLQTVKYVVLQEHIKLGQRVKSFSVEALADGTWREIATGTTIGYKVIKAVTPVKTQNIRVNIKESKACPVISQISLY